MPIKPPDRELKLDGYEQVVDGETYRPHEGESIWLEAGDPVEDALDRARAGRFATRIEAAKGDPNEVEQAGQIMSDLLDDVVAFLAPRIVRWNVTNRRGDPIPSPDGDPKGVLKLSKSVLLWIYGQSQTTETAADRKNG